MFRPAFLFLFLAAAFPALAQEALFSSEIKVEVTAADAVQAREQALAQAQKQGFEELVERLSPEQKEKILKSTDAATRAAMIRGTEVLEEKISGKTWRGRVKVTYDALPISGLLEQRVSAEGIPENAEASSAMVVIPLYEENGARMLWEPENPWASVWRQVTVERAGGNLVVPFGDNIDAAPVTAGAADTAAYPAFAPLIARYGTGTVIVVKAAYSEEPHAHITVVKRLLTRTRDEISRMDYEADPIEDKNALFKRAAQDLSEQLDRQRGEMLVQKELKGGTGKKMTITVPLRRIESWTRIRGTLRSLPSVARVEEISVSPRQVVARIHYTGRTEDLSTGLASKGLRVKTNADNWVISDE